MRIIADFHIHSKYSRATSLNMNVDEVTRFAQIKGLNLVGTGDFTHPKWLNELKQTLTPIDNTGLHKPSTTQPSITFILSSEICTIFEYEGKSKKIHHVLVAPDFEVVSQINDRLSKYGNLAVDGRPMLDMTAAEMVEEVMAVSPRNIVFPSHAWTPWFSIFGAFSGFDRFDDCYQDMTKHIHALETGLSSDPAMNWRLSSLDRFTIVSNSDSHSAWPWRIGREANVFELDELTYDEVTQVLTTKDPKRFRLTIETDPAYGKYHWSGHRRCNVSMSPTNAMKSGNLCPKCGRKLTKGVEQRVEELADRPLGFRPENAVGFIHLLPLSEIVATVIGAEQPSSSKVWEIYNTLIGKLGNEFHVLLNASREEIANLTNEAVADAVIRVREDRVKVIPGYDGVYGKIEIFAEEVSSKVQEERPTHTRLDEFL